MDETTLEPDSESIRALARELWQARGCPEGSPEIDWFAAEKQLTGEQPSVYEIAQEGTGD